ncbi:MAG: potassium-transporting ATPase subunit KdpC [Cypionkella sp.]|jgi:potassium-transporting ATPase KdpC subunit
MFTHLRPAFVMLLLFTLLLGLAYPLALTGVAGLAFPAQASGSQLQEGDHLIGSALIGQSFTAPGYFHPRPSAAGYDAMASGGTNLGPLSKKLIDRVSGDLAGMSRPVPADAVTASASGLDPDISPQNALSQVARVAGARKLPVDKVAALVADHTQGRLFGLIGEPRVNVLALNLALDKIAAN